VFGSSILEDGHTPVSIQEGQGVNHGYLLLGVYDRRTPSVTGIKTTQNFRLIWNLLRKMQKNLLTKKLQAKEVCKIGFCPLLYY
jgi:hypothetical protein